MTELSAINSRQKIETSISERTFARISATALSEAGIVLSPAKVSMVKSRLTRRLRALNLSTFDEYMDNLAAPDGASEMDNFISALTTNVSHFFRENHHFEYLTQNIIPVLKQKIAGGGKARIWSAGCSNGQEPYSIAIALLTAAPELANKDIKILATDIDPEVLERAKSGEYFGTLTTGLSDEVLSNHFKQSTRGDEEVFLISEKVKSMVSFRQLNLHSNWPMKGKFDVIFCRNVVIYFDEETQTRLFHRFAEILEPGGWLMLGHSERLNEHAVPAFENSGVTTYRTKKTGKEAKESTNETISKGVI